MKNLLFTLNNYFSPNGYNITKQNLPLERYQMHFHDCIEISLLSQGTGMQNINGTEYYMPTYTFTIMHNHDCHRYYDLSPDNTLYNLMLLPSLLPDHVIKQLDSLPSDKICVLPETVGKSTASVMEAILYSQNCQQDYPKDFLPNLFQDLVAIFLHHYAVGTSSTSDSTGNILQNALIYINSHYTNALDLNEIAEYAKCCPTYLSDLFHKKMNMTIKQYINVMRLKHAKKLLISSDLSIMSISFESGFASLASFNRNFLKSEKMSPTAYKKSYTNALINDGL